jgi:hypothetical protein
MHGMFYIARMRKHPRDEEQRHVSDLSDLDLQSDKSTVELSVQILAKVQ